MKDHQAAAFADGFVFLEGPRWHGGALWVSDMWDHCVYRIAPDGERELVVRTEQRPSGLGFLPDGTPLVVSMGDRRIFKIVDGGTREYADLSGVATGDTNDMIVDSLGRAYVGNLGYDMLAGEDPAPADIGLVDVDGSVRVAAAASEFPNGMALIDDERVLVVAETWAKRLIAYDRAPDGLLSNRRLFADLGERTPDGICADREGGVWISGFHNSEFVRVLEGGVVTDRVACPGRMAVACALGGEDGRTLYCATFSGELEDIQNRRRKSSIEVARVDVGALND